MPSMCLRQPRLVALVATVAFTVAFTAVPVLATGTVPVGATTTDQPPAQDPAPAAIPKGARAAAGATVTRVDTVTDPCQHVVVVGARGSGESPKKTYGIGETVFEAVMRYATKLPGYKVGVRPVDYPARDVKNLLTVPTRFSYFLGLEDGYRDAADYLTKRSTRCPDERYVLAGYSQGAMVMHRLMWSLPGTTSRGLSSRIDGFLLIADGDRTAKEGGRHHGSSNNNHRNHSGVTFSSMTLALAGVLPRWRAQNKDVPLKFSTQDAHGHVAWHSVCKEGDIVCDTRTVLGTGKLAAAIGTHTTYTGYAKVKEAAFQIAEATRAHKPLTTTPTPGPSTPPTPTPPTPGPTATPTPGPTTAPTPTAIPGTAIKLPLAGNNYPYSGSLANHDPRPGTWTMSAGSLPPGLTLHPKGTITGAPEPGNAGATFHFTALLTLNDGTSVAYPADIARHTWTVVLECVQDMDPYPDRDDDAPMGVIFGYISEASGEVVALFTVRGYGSNPTSWIPGWGPANIIGFPMELGEVYDADLVVEGYESARATGLFLGSSDCRDQDLPT